MELEKNLVYQKRLEQVKSGTRPNPIMTLLLGLLLFVAIFLLSVFAYALAVNSWNHLYDSRQIRADALLFMAIPFVMALCIVGVILKYVREEVFWCTDTEGVTARTAFRSRRALWSDVTEVSLTKSFLRGNRIMFKTGKRAACISALPIKDPLFEASLWQSLKSKAITARIRLSSDAKSLFTEIPDSVPGEIDCCFDGYGRACDDSDPEVRIEVNRDNIISFAYGERAEIMWFDVKHAYWSDNTIIIEGKSNLLKRDEIYVPAGSSNPHAVNLALAVIRRLRECDPPQMIIIPAKLRSAQKHISFEGENESVNS